MASLYRFFPPQSRRMGKATADFGGRRQIRNSKIAYLPKQAQHEGGRFAQEGKKSQESCARRQRSWPGPWPQPGVFTMEEAGRAAATTKGPRVRASTSIMRRALGGEAGTPRAACGGVVGMRRGYVSSNDPAALPQTALHAPFLRPRTTGQPRARRGAGAPPGAQLPTGNSFIWNPEAS